MVEIIDPVMIDVPMPIRTPHLLIRNVRPSDGAAISVANNETIEDLKKWMDWAHKPQTPEACEKTARESYADFILRKDLRMIGFEHGSERPVIFTGLHRMCWHSGRFEVGFYVRKSEQGKGFATEATIALTRYAFDALGANRVEIMHDEDNIASKRVIEKCGFSFEGRMKDRVKNPNGILRSHCIYSHTDLSNVPDLEVRW